MLENQSRQLQQFHEEKEISAKLVENFQITIADLEGKVCAREITYLKQNVL